MPRFYFHVRDGDELIEDPEGIEMPGSDAAEAEATTAARELLAEQLKFGSALDSRAFEILDEKGEKVLSLPFRSVLRLD
ncbi:MAG: hypothetical protein KL863_18750 [Rhizobium sp.]|nr:hypothetical protein [Rhizobium sp.]